MRFNWWPPVSLDIISTSKTCLYVFSVVQRIITDLTYIYDILRVLKKSSSSQLCILATHWREVSVQVQVCAHSLIIDRFGCKVQLESFRSGKLYSPVKLGTKGYCFLNSELRSGCIYFLMHWARWRALSLLINSS